MGCLHNATIPAMPDGATKIAIPREEGPLPANPEAVPEQ
jgi:hypothetical protein